MLHLFMPSNLKVSQEFKKWENANKLSIFTKQFTSHNNNRDKEKDILPAFKNINCVQTKATKEMDLIDSGIDQNLYKRITYLRR